MDIVVRFSVTVFLVLFSIITPSNAATAPPSGGGGGGGDAHSMPCIQKLMPCQPYLHTVTPPPPPTCCVPLKEIVATDVTCLCAVFTNVDMLKSLNLTKENALDLPKACGANADVSQCKDSSSGNSTSPATPKAPPTPSTGSGSTGDSASHTTTKPTNSAPAIKSVGVSFASAFVATLLFF